MHTIKAGIDVGAGLTIVAALIGWLPAVSAVLAIAWYGIQIYESKTVQDWLNRK